MQLLQKQYTEKYVQSHISLHIIYLFHITFRMFLLQNKPTRDPNLERCCEPTEYTSNEMKLRLSIPFSAFAAKFFLSWQKTHSGLILFLESIYFLIQDL